MRGARVTVCLAAVLVLGACDADEEPAAPDEQVEAPDTGEDAADAAADAGAQDDADGAEDTEGPAATPDGATDGPALATTEHPIAEHDASLAIELRAQETGDLLRVSLTFTPEGLGEDSSLAELFGSPGSGNGFSGRVIDADNLLEYSSVRSAVPHGSSVSIQDGQPVTLHFYVGAPVEPMDRFDFLLDFGSGAPNWQGFVDVPYPDA